MSKLITKTSGKDYDYQYEIISRIEAEGGDPSDAETWDRVAIEVAEEEEEEEDETP